MPREIIIGRSSSSALPVPLEKTGVSGSHVKITISDSGDWEIEDLQSTNGTFVKDDNGDFQQVYKKRIDENTIIRLGQEGHDSFLFMAHRAAEPDSSYSYEFRQLKKQLKKQTEAEESMEKKNARNMNIMKLAAPIAMLVCIVLQFAIPAIKENAELNLWISRIGMGLAPAVAGMFLGIDRNAVKNLRMRRAKVLTCPKCGRQLSEYDIHNMQCSYCKAK